MYRNNKVSFISMHIILSTTSSPTILCSIQPPSCLNMSSATVITEPRSSDGDQKPPVIRRQQTTLIVDTQYEHMLRELDNIPWKYNFLSSFAGWSLLAGFLVIPGTFTSLQGSDKIQQGLSTSKTERAILDTIQNPPLVGIACSLLVVGAGTMAFLFFRWRNNYLWLVNRLFM